MEPIPRHQNLAEVSLSQDASERCLIIRSRIAAGYTLSDAGLKNLQHVLTDWLPRSIYFDLTEDTVCAEVEAEKSFTGKLAFAATLLRSDTSVIKKIVYLEESMLGKVCKPFDTRRTRYDGKRDGFDHRLVIYKIEQPVLKSALQSARC